jgi:DNA-binding LacI/PurR family transcriptional regulator
METMERLGLEPMIISAEGEGWQLERIGYEAATRAIGKKSLPTDSVLCSNDRLAIGFLAACYENGLRVGRGGGCALRVAGLDDHPYSRFTCPSLTTVGHDYEVIAERGVEKLLELIEGGGHFSERTEDLFPARLVLRESA